MIAEMRAPAPNIRDYTDYVREFLHLSENALRAGQALKAAYYLRSAEFYMLPDDPRKPSARGEFVCLTPEYFGVAPKRTTGFPTVGRRPPAIGSPIPFRAAPSCCLAASNSYVEELFPMQAHPLDAGFNVISFDGPGQDAALEDEHLAMTPDREKPVSPVLDYFHLNNVTLIGYLSGGCLAMRYLRDAATNGAS